MKLDFIEACGFRGFRNKVRIECGPGFTVVTGRNGAGKSSLCDAIDFAITGSINKFTAQKSGMESADDYVWWRGVGETDAQYVTVSFRKEDGTSLTVTRTRTSGANLTDREIEDALCLDSRPANALRQLCKTSIIRDEWIAALSLDLSETERFELVRSALGSMEGSELAIRANHVVCGAKTIHQRNESSYQASRSELAKHLEQLSESKALISSSDDIAAAMRLVAAEVPNAPPDSFSRLRVGRHTLVDRRVKIGRATEVIAEGRELLRARRALDTPEEQARRDAVRVSLEGATAKKEEAERLVSLAQQALMAEEGAHAVAESLAALLDHGKKIGLHDSRCPLCSAVRTPEEFAAGLLASRKRVDSFASGLSAAREALSTAQSNAQGPLIDYDRITGRWISIEREEASLVHRESRFSERFQEVSIAFPMIRDIGDAETVVAAERERLIELERALLTLEASEVVSRTASLERRTEDLRTSVESAAEAVERSQAAVDTSQAIERAVKRVNAEIIDERLAQMSPLLNDLYQRLRPHADWRDLDYHIRGDVRRYLSLRVGDMLNPQFVLSSGQRRAVGLAFLLSVHLARAWTPWCTLVLDDPVQHIDDFRALHFVEILSALRLSGRQIICAVEDESLSRLLCRRLMSTPDEMGRYYELDLGKEGIPAVVENEEILPLPTWVLDPRSHLTD